MVGQPISKGSLNIALVSPYDFVTPGGVNDHISNLARQLRNKGHRVSIIAPNSKERGYVEGGYFIGKPIPFPSGGSIARITLSLSVFWQIRRILNEEKFDVIHLHEPLAPFLPLATLVFSDAINIGTFHAFQGTKLNSIWSIVTRKLFNKLNSRIAVSLPAMTFVSKYYPADYEIIPNGVDIDRFSQREGLDKYRDGKVNILFLGRMEKRKGFKHLLNAYLEIKQQFPNIRLIVAGGNQPDKESRGVLKDQASLDIEWVGQISNADVPKYYQAADIFCAPNTGNESFGIVLLEAMASGKPIIASEIEGFSQVMQNGREGIMCEPENEIELSKALVKLIKNVRLRSDMGASGRLTASKYSWDIIATEIEEIYYKSIFKYSEVGEN